MMRRILFFLLFLTLLLSGKEIVVITHKNFPLQHIGTSELRAIFLDKKHFVREQKILPINYSFTDPLRICFEKNILKKNRRSLERYWLKAHYNGKRPPKVVKSKVMLLEYLQKVPGSIGYIDTNTSLDNSFKILLKVPCK